VETSGMNLRGRGVFAAGDSIRARLFIPYAPAKMEKRDVLRKFFWGRVIPSEEPRPVIPSEEREARRRGIFFRPSGSQLSAPNYHHLF
jgi:hypothetical protein